MTQRERVLCALTGEAPDRVPWGLDGFNRSVSTEFLKRTGTEDFLSYFRLDYRFPSSGDLDLDGMDPREKYSVYYKDLPESADVDEWGIAYIPGSNPAFDVLVSPLKSIKGIQEIEEYPFPDLKNKSRYSGLRESVEEIHRRELASVGGLQQTIFEIAWGIRGFAELMMDFAVNPRVAEYLLDGITELRRFQAEQYARAGVDVIMLGDDVGMQDRMLMNPDTWRRWLKPRLRSVIEGIHSVKPDTIIFYHCDGFIEPIIEDLVEIGVSVLNPVQPECMNPEELRAKYGKKLAFWGTVGIQTTLPFGSPDEIRELVKSRIDTLGRDGGLLISPTHAIEPDVPWKNLMAFVEACRMYG